MIVSLYSRILMVHSCFMPLTISLGLCAWEVINDPYLSRIVSFSLPSPFLTHLRLSALMTTHSLEFKNVL